MKSLLLMALSLLISETYACEIDHFQCYDFTGCIDNTLVCNGVEDCLNGKDEAQCGSCPTRQFQCSVGGCIANTGVCDRIAQCTDGSDESSCGCSSFEWGCDNGQCVEELDRCDGFPDCDDGSDEDGCLNIVGIAVGVAIAGIFLLVILPAVIVIIIVFRLRNGRNRYETVVVTPGPGSAPTTGVYTQTHANYGVYRAS